jgi:hypothetical protein
MVNKDYFFFNEKNGILNKKEYGNTYIMDFYGVRDDNHNCLGINF